MKKLFRIVWIIECFLVFGIGVDDSEAFAQFDSPLIPWAVGLGFIGLFLKHWDRIEKLFNGKEE
jgi:hypothetical protein